MRDQDFVNRIEIATPCDRTWDSLVGDERRRYCGDCRLHVYNFSAMTARETRSLLQTAEGRVCGRYFRKADGTVIVQDCGPIRAAIHRRTRRIRVAAAALFGLVSTFTFGACGPAGGGETGTNPPAATGGSSIETPSEAGPELLGEVCVPEAPETVETPDVEPVIEELGEVVVHPEFLGRIAAPVVIPKPKPTPPEKD